MRFSYGAHFATQNNICKLGHVFFFIVSFILGDM